VDRAAIAQQIVEWERRNDSQGRIRLYPLPKNDGGGRYEYAGINERWHPKALHAIEKLVNAGNHEAAETYARKYIDNYVHKAAELSSLPAVDLFLCDTAFNRGPTGAKKVAQMAIGAKPDGQWGPISRAAMDLAERDPSLLLAKLRRAREHYENIVAPGRANLRKGMINRWDKVFAAASAVQAQAA